MQKNDWKQYMENWEAAAEDERRLTACEPRLTPAESFRRSLALVAFAETVTGDPFKQDNPIDEAEKARVAEAWMTLRARWNRGR